ncbi:hypothetical protein [Brevibacillus centrosporus]|uniref:hypothetical protein n=1 Tax=Brevibacillus centrosporus TaxID=54910 RepID=UPI002E1AE914|nr:hypothetical protein [Brevibacillus centrosporus]
MFQINRTTIETEMQTATSKTSLGENNTPVFQGFYLVMCNIKEKIRKFSVYDMGHWSVFVDRWLNNFTYVNNNTYQRGQIVKVDLGANNFRYEPSYSHPCIIIAASKDNILIVPGSTKKYGSRYNNIISVPNTPGGFARPTGLQMEGVRWVHKNRITSSVLGNADVSVLKQVDEYLLKSNVTVKNTLRAQENVIKAVRADLAKEQLNTQALTAQVASLESQIATQSQTIESLNQRIQKYDDWKQVLMQFQELSTKKGLFENGQNEEMKQLLEKMAE